MQTTNSKSKNAISQSEKKADFLRTLAVSGKNAAMAVGVSAIAMSSVWAVERDNKFFLAFLLGGTVIMLNLIHKKAFKDGTSMYEAGSQMFDNCVAQIKNICTPRVKGNVK